MFECVAGLAFGVDDDQIGLELGQAFAQKAIGREHRHKVEAVSSRPMRSMRERSASRRACSSCGSGTARSGATTTMRRASFGHANAISVPKYLLGGLSLPETY